MLDVIASIQSAIDIAAKLRVLSKKVEDADFKMLLADLSGDLADAKLEVAQLKIEISRLTSENAELKEKLNARVTSKPDVSEGAYVFSGEEGHFCTACFDVHGRKVRLASLPDAFRDLARWQCPSCQATI